MLRLRVRSGEDRGPDIRDRRRRRRLGAGPPDPEEGGGCCQSPRVGDRRVLGPDPWGRICAAYRPPGKAGLGGTVTWFSLSPEAS